MKVCSIITLALVGLATAGKCRPHDGEKKCLSKKDVKELSDAYVRLIGAFNETDLEYLSDDWADYSQSINAFIGDPTQEEAVTFADKEAFKTAQLRSINNPTPLVIQGDPVKDCRKFAIIWTSTFGNPPLPARGITVINAKPVKGGKPVMTRWDVEFNSLNWAVNTGGSYCLNLPPQAGGPRIEGNPTCGVPPVETL